MTAVQLHHVADGPVDAPVLLLAGSLGTNLGMWEPNVPKLAARYRVIRLDHRGHGRSPVPAGPYAIADLGGDVIALMDRLNIGAATFGGLSIGGMVGQWLAIHHPERITRLIVMCSAPRTLNGDAFRARAQAVREAGTPAVVADAVVAKWFTPAYAAEHPDVVARHREMIATTPAEGYAASCEAVAGHDVLAGLPGVRAPTLVMSGADDEAIPPDQGRAIAEAIPGARFALLSPGAHLSSVERADEVSRLILHHLQGATP